MVPVDRVVVGAGFAGCVVAEREAARGRSVLLVDQRPQIGGNAFDEYDDAGILVHRYGPHIFHTNDPTVWAYLSRFTDWRPYSHSVLTSVDGRLLPFPVNLDTVNELFGLRLAPPDVQHFLTSHIARETFNDPPENSRDVIVKQVGDLIYRKFFEGYTRKQWNLDPTELDASVIGRVPFRNSRDPRYFLDRYQAMPRHGYSRLFRRMTAHPKIRILLKTPYRDLDGALPADQSVIYTGPIDEYFGRLGYSLGRLPYRSARFEFETLDVERAQAAPVINYPNDHEYTRVAEFKQLTGQQHRQTTLCYEFSTAEGDPYHPIPTPASARVYQRYMELARKVPHVRFLGRLGSYKYLNMDQVVAQALKLARILEKEINPA